MAESPLVSRRWSKPPFIKDPRLRWALGLGLALLVAGGFFTSAEAQFANGYSYRREVDFVDGQVVSGPHTNFPVLVDVTLLDLRTTGNGGKVENASGFDIIFTSDQAGTNQASARVTVVAKVAS